MTPIRILLVDDQPRVRSGLRMRLAIEPGLEVVGEAENGAQALSTAARLHPDVVVMDVEMPVMDGIAAAARLTSAPDAPAVVILTLHDCPEVRERASAAGASAFVAKHQIDPALLDAIRAAARGRRGQPHG